MQIQMEVTQKMKLYNIYRLCKQNIDFIDKFEIVVSEELNATKTSKIKVYIIKNWLDIRSIIIKLSKVPALKNSANSLINSIPDTINYKECLCIDIDIYNIFNRNRNMLVDKMQNIIDLYESMHIENEGIGIDIKLPNCEDLSEYISYLKEINFIFTQCPFLQCKDETIKFGSVDVGSNWLKLTVATASTIFILTNTASLIDKALILRSHYITLQQQEELLKSQQQKNELSQENIDTFNSLKTTYMNIIIEQLEKESEISLDHEERDKTERSLEKLILLLNKGCEIYASLDAPEEVQTLFPEIQGSLELPDNIMKYLEEKSDLITE